jgi:hypothetical protein
MSATVQLPAPSPLLLCDTLITLAQQADRAGYTVTARHLALLAEAMFEERPAPAPPPNG